MSVFFQVCCTDEMSSQPQAARPPVTTQAIRPTRATRPNFGQSQRASSIQSSGRRQFQASDLPQPGVCGFSLGDRVIGGNTTSITEYPWMALIQYTKRKTIFTLFITII